MQTAFSFPLYTFRKPTPKKPITSLVVFGDSLSDTGNLSTFSYQATGGLFWFPPSPPLPGPDSSPYYAKSPYYNSAPLGSIPKVRVTNGFNWVDYLSNQLKLPTTNLAVAGATTGNSNGLQPFLPSNFPALPGLANEISSFTNNLGNRPADPQALYVIWAGANDIFNLTAATASLVPTDFTGTLSIIAGVVKNAINNITTDITTLAGKGARVFMVPNLPDLGKTPLLRQSQSTALIGRVASLAFDIELAVQLPKLERSLNIDIVQPDVYSLVEAVVKRPQEFGFKNVTDPLIGQNPNDPLIKPDEFLFYDSQHPTTAGQRLISDLFQDSLFKEGYINQRASTSLPYIPGSLWDKELSLVGTLINGISDLQPKELISSLWGLIPNAISSTPNFTIQSGDNALSHLTLT